MIIEIGKTKVDDVTPLAINIEQSLCCRSRPKMVQCHSLYFSWPQVHLLSESGLLLIGLILFVFWIAVCFAKNTSFSGKLNPRKKLGLNSHPYLKNKWQLSAAGREKIIFSLSMFPLINHAEMDVFIQYKLTLMGQKETPNLMGRKGDVGLGRVEGKKRLSKHIV